MREWAPDSWRKLPIVQDVSYIDPSKVEAACDKLRKLPPIVTPFEIQKLRKDLRDVAEGKAFLLQGGDCAELFDYCESNAIEAKVRLLLQMSLVLVWGANVPVVRIARMAGQYAKPRSSPKEQVNGITVDSFRGDILNGFELHEREPDPGRLVQAYFHSAATVNYLRAILASGFADLHNSFDWSLSHVQSRQVREEYQCIVSSLTSTLAFMHTIKADTSASLGTADIYTSHEGLVLEYEEALTRYLRDNKGHRTWFDSSAHFIWIGDRTRQLDHGHVEFFRGIQNPIGIKVGPSMEPSELSQLLQIVDPYKDPGKVTLITRYGFEKIASKLPAHIDAVRKSGHVVVWVCDPMHGNTHSTSTGIKTRQFDDIISEISSAIRIHKQRKSRLNGVHLELTGDPVTECLGGSEGLTTDDLKLRYTTYCDPRLNEKQALDVAFLVATNYRHGNLDLQNGTVGRSDLAKSAE